jgi:hypothetical protein
MERPRINIANIVPREIKLFEQVFDLELRIQNPNDTPLAVNGLAFELELNDKRFATGVSNQSLVIDAVQPSSWSHHDPRGFLRQIAVPAGQDPHVTYRWGSISRLTRLVLSVLWRGQIPSVCQVKAVGLYLDQQTPEEEDAVVQNQSMVNSFE